MSADRDMTRIVRSWLRTDEHESADRVLDHVLAVLDATPQHRSPWPVRRIADMNLFAKLATAAALMLVVVVAGLSFAPRGTVGPGNVSTPAPSASPSASPSPTPSPTPRPTFLPDGEVPVGRYPMIREGVRLSIDVPTTGWTSGLGVFIDKSAPTEPDGAALVFWEATPDNVYSDPCAKVQLDPPPARTALALTTAVGSIPGTELVSGPTAVTIGGHPAQRVAIRIPDDIGCAPEKFFLWTDERDTFGGRYATAPGMTFTVWIVDVNGKLIWIDGETYAGSDPKTSAEIQAIVDSIRFDQAG
jgi:hypothetical protein